MIYNEFLFYLYEKNLPAVMLKRTNRCFLGTGTIGEITVHRNRRTITVFICLIRFKRLSKLCGRYPVCKQSVHYSAKICAKPEMAILFGYRKFCMKIGGNMRILLMRPMNRPIRCV